MRLTDVIFMKLTTSLRQRQNLTLTVDFYWCFLVLGNHCWLPILLIFLSVIFQKKESLLRGNTTPSRHALTENRPFLLQIAACHTSVGYISTHLPSPLHSKLFQSAKKNIFTTCHSGKLKLAFTSPDIISASSKNFLTSRIEFTVLLLFEFLKKHHLLVGQVKHRIH